ncbi:unnamed protein product [Ectocarpus sp. 13 AM-2016]
MVAVNLCSPGGRCVGRFTVATCRAILIVRYTRLRLVSSVRSGERSVRELSGGAFPMGYRSPACCFVHVAQQSIRTMCLVVMK